MPVRLGYPLSALSQRRSLTIMPLCFVCSEIRASARFPRNGLPRSLCHVDTAAKKESQAKSILALSQMSQAGSHPPKALPNVPSGSEVLVLFLPRKFPAQPSPVALALHELGALTQPRSQTRETDELETVLESRGLPCIIPIRGP